MIPLKDVPEFMDLVKRVHALENGMNENNAATARIETNTKDLVASFQAVQGTFKLLEWTARTSKFLTPIVLLVGAFTFDIKTVLNNIGKFLGH